MKDMSLLRRGVLFLICGVLFACQANAIKIHIRFNDVQGLVEGDRVLADAQQIGKVTKVTYTSKGDFIVDVVVAGRFKEKLTENARFYIIADPDASERKAVEIVQADNPGNLLADGAVVQGSTMVEDMVNDLVTGMQKGLDELEDQLQEFLGALKEVPKKEEIQRLRKELEELAERMKKAGKAAKEKLEKEVLPKLEEEIERLKEKLRKLGREKEVEPLETELNELKKI